MTEVDASEFYQPDRLWICIPNNSECVSTVDPTCSGSLLVSQACVGSAAAGLIECLLDEAPEKVLDSASMLLVGCQLSLHILE